MQRSRAFAGFQLGALAAMAAGSAEGKLIGNEVKIVYVDEVADEKIAPPPHKPPRAGFYDPRFLPHQGKRECERRMRQQAKLKAKVL